MASTATKATHPPTWPATNIGFSKGDLDLLWKAILNMFEHDYFIDWGKMVVGMLIIF